MQIKRASQMNARLLRITNQNQNLHEKTKKV